MSDDEIVKRISVQLGLMAALAFAAKFAGTDKAKHFHRQAARFAQFSLRLIATHKEACERWMNARKAELNSHA